MRLPDLSPPFEPGTVWLVGAGPGDPGLLTLHALHALGAADAVVYDALVDPRILALAAPRARRVDVGKRAGRPSMAQTDITAQLIAFARSGERVLRLKGGDPFVFGRGGEEAQALAAAGIRFRVVPGVSSGLAALALHGVPATDRTTNNAVILATGHVAPGARDVNWAALARTGAPIILYMSITNLPAIVAKLRAAGLAGGTPVLGVHAATTEAEEVVEATLETLPACLASGALRAPAIVAIGPIVAIRRALHDHLLGPGRSGEAAA